MTHNKAQLQSFGITVIRLVMGAVFIAHGAQKLFGFGLEGVAGGFAQMGIPLPTVSAYLVTGAELFGGIALVLGLFTRLATLPLAFSMLVAMVMVHAKAGFFLPNGYEFVLTLLAGTVGLALAGPGALAVDNVIAARRERTGVAVAPVQTVRRAA